MRNVTLLLATAAVVLTFAPPLHAADAERVPPAFRDERHFASGAEYLRALPDGTEIAIERADGFSFVLHLVEGALRTQLPPASIEDEAATLVLPSGYRIRFVADDDPPGVDVASPKGKISRFVPRTSRMHVWESDLGFWRTNVEPLILRFPDGTRVDAMDRGVRWEALTLGGERYRMSLPEGRWQALPSLPSPPLVPAMGSFYLAGDGDDWRRPVAEDHPVFGWNWIQVGLPIERLLEDVSAFIRREDLRLYFQKLENVQPPAEMAAAIVARRLALSGGDQVIFRAPGQEPVVTFVFPGEVEPNYIEAKSERPMQLTSPKIAPEK